MDWEIKFSPCESYPEGYWAVNSAAAEVHALNCFQSVSVSLMGCSAFKQLKLPPEWLFIALVLLTGSLVPAVWIDLLHWSHNAPVLYPIMHYFVTEMCTCTFLLQNGALWHVYQMNYGICEMGLSAWWIAVLTLVVLGAHFDNWCPGANWHHVISCQIVEINMDILMHEIEKHSSTTRVRSL